MTTVSTDGSTSTAAPVVTVGEEKEYATSDRFDRETIDFHQ